MSRGSGVVGPDLDETSLDDPDLRARLVAPFDEPTVTSVELL